MGRKNIVYDYKPIIDGDMEGALIIGEPSTVAQFDTVTYEFSWEGGDAVNGDFSVEYSRDEEEPKEWKELDFGATINSNGAEGVHRLIITEVGFKFTRPKYTQTDSDATGTLNVSVFATNKGA